MSKFLAKLLSYLCAFNYGGYFYATMSGHPVEFHRWLLTGILGLFFYVCANEK